MIRYILATVLLISILNCKKQNSVDEKELPLEEIHGKILYTNSLNLVELDIQSGISKEIENGLGLPASWSPNGDLMMWSDRISNGSRVIKITDNQGNSILEFENPDIHHSCWSPDGQKVAFFNYLKDVIAKIDLTTFVRDTIKFHAGNLFWQQGYPDWSPDGNTFVFTAHQTETGLFNMWRIDSNGENLTQLTTGGAHRPQWSPDGQKIAYSDLHSIRIMSPGQNNQSLIEGGEGPQWSADGKLVMYQFLKESGIGAKGYEIRVRNLETGQERLIVEHAVLLDWHSAE